MAPPVAELLVDEPLVAAVAIGDAPPVTAGAPVDDAPPVPLGPRDDLPPMAGDPPSGVVLLKIVPLVLEATVKVEAPVPPVEVCFSAELNPPADAAPVEPIPPSETCSVLDVALDLPPPAPLVLLF